jgi:polyisoprenoid-binding protein YceI
MNWLRRFSLDRVGWQTLLVIYLCCLMSGQVTAQTALPVLPAASTASFTIKNFGLTVDGGFKQLSGTIAFDPNQLADSYLQGEAKVASIYTGNSTRDRHLLGEDYFDASAYPTIQFRSSKIEHVSGGTYRLTGALTIKDVTQRVVVQMVVLQQGDRRLFITNFELDRTVYHVGKKGGVLGQSVKLAITFATAVPIDRPTQHR